MTTTVYECIYCDFTTEDEQGYNRHMFDHQEVSAWEDEESEDIDSWKLGYSGASDAVWGPHDACQGMS